MGRPQVERIRKLEDACLELYARTGRIEPDDVRALVWDPLLQRLDSADLDAALVRHELEQTLSDELEMDMRRVRLELDGPLHSGRQVADSVPELASRIARSRTSGENLFVFLMAPSSQELGPPPNPGRFRAL
ncbi:hypothetical protein ACKVEX_16050 [Rhodocyclaceae bacterium SMB388]